MGVGGGGVSGLFISVSLPRGGGGVGGCAVIQSGEGAFLKSQSPSSVLCSENLIPPRNIPTVVSYNIQKEADWLKSHGQFFFVFWVFFYDAGSLDSSSSLDGQEMDFHLCAS